MLQTVLHNLKFFTYQKSQADLKFLWKGKLSNE